MVFILLSLSVTSANYSQSQTAPLKSLYLLTILQESQEVPVLKFKLSLDEQFPLVLVYVSLGHRPEPSNHKSDLMVPKMCNYLIISADYL